MKKAVIVLGCVTVSVVVAIVALMTYSFEPGPSGPAWPGTAPVGGDSVSFATAARRAGSPLPIVRPVAVKGPCSDGPVTVTLVGVKQSSGDMASRSPLFGMSYTDGVWMTLKPLAGVKEGKTKAGELVWAPEVVRGHRARIKELSADFDCERDDKFPPANGGALSPSVSVDPFSTGVAYDPSSTASVRWVEKGFLIEIGGPFPADQMRNLAEGIEFTSKA